MNDAEKNNPEINEATMNGQPILSNHTAMDTRFYNFPQKVEKNGFVHNLSVVVDAIPSLLCVGDKVSFIAISGDVGVSTDVSQIYVLFIDSRSQVQQSYNFTEMENEIETSVLSKTPVIELTPDTNNTYEYDPVMIGTQPTQILDTGGLPPFSFSNVGDKIVQIFLIHGNNGRIETKIDYVPFFTVSPSSACLQVTVERDTMQEMRKQNITDEDIIALSWMAVGLALVVVGVDIGLRITLDPYTAEMKTQRLFDWKKLKWYSDGDP